jgi:hypothetical protein
MNAAVCGISAEKPVLQAFNENKNLSAFAERFSFMF